MRTSAPPSSIGHGVTERVARAGLADVRSLHDPPEKRQERLRRRGFQRRAWNPRHWACVRRVHREHARNGAWVSFASPDPGTCERTSRGMPSRRSRKEGTSTSMLNRARKWTASNARDGALRATDTCNRIRCALPAARMAQRSCADVKTRSQSTSTPEQKPAAGSLRNGSVSQRSLISPTSESRRLCPLRVTAPFAPA